MLRCWLTTMGSFLALGFSLSACATVPAPGEVLPVSVVAAVGGTVAQSIVADERVTACWESLDSQTRCLRGPWHSMDDDIKYGIARRRVMTLREQTGDVDFRAQYAQALRSTLSEVGWLNLRRLEPLESAPSHVNERDAVLRITTYQSLSSSSQSLIVESVFEFYPAGARDDAPSARTRVRYESEEIGPERDVIAVAHWAQDHGRAYRRFLAEGIAQNMKMTTLALQRMGGTADRATEKSSSPSAVTPSLVAPTEQGETSQGRTLVDETAERVILAVELHGQETLISLPKRASCGHKTPTAP